MRPVRGTANPPSGGNYAGTNRFPPGQHQDSESGGFGDDPWAASTSLDAGAMEDTPMDTSTPVSFEDEPPLLEELGINFDHIWKKTLSVLNPVKDIAEIAEDADLAGPLVFCLVLGLCLLLQGKLHFGYIYGFGVTGCLAMFAVLNLMSQEEWIELHRVCSILGYGLLPIVVLAAVSVFFDLRGPVGLFLSLATTAWCTHTSSRFFEGALHMQHRRWLIAYPAFLLYACFGLITVF